MAHDKSWLHQVWRRFQYSSIGKTSARPGASRWRIKDVVRTRSERLVAWLQNRPCHHYGHRAQIPELFQRRDLTLLALYNARLRLKTPPPKYHHDLLDAAATLGALEVRLGYTFQNRMTGIEALKVTGNVHSLYYDGAVYETGMNNRLALLGDRVLSLALCEIWFQTDHLNGGYALMSSQTVSRAALAVTGHKLGLHLSILTGDGKGVTRDNIAETFEAIMGAVYVDSGYNMKVVKDVIGRQKIDDHFYLKSREEIKESDILKEPINQNSETSSCEQGTTARDEQNGPMTWAEMDVKNVILTHPHRRNIKRLERWINQGSNREKSAMALRALQKYARLVKQGTRPDPMTVFSGIERAEKLSYLVESEKDSSESHKYGLEEAKEKSMNFGVREKHPGFRRLTQIMEPNGPEESRHKRQALQRHAHLPEQGQNRKPLNVRSELQNGVAPSQIADLRKDASESPEKGLREAEPKRVNTEAVERSVREFSEPKVSSSKSSFDHDNGKVEFGAEKHRNHVNMVQESQHTMAKEDEAKEVYTVNSMPHKRPSTRFSPLRSTATEPSVEKLEQTTVASHIDAWASLDSEANTKPLVEFASERPFLESDMDRFFGGLLYRDFHETAGDGLRPRRIERTHKAIKSNPRTIKELLSLANIFNMRLAKGMVVVARQTHLIRLRIRTAASSKEKAQVLPVVKKCKSADNRSSMRTLFEAVIITAMENGLRFGSTAWSIFVRNSLERGEKDPQTAKIQLWRAKNQEEIELFGEENRMYYNPSAVQKAASNTSTGRSVGVKGQPESPTSELRERTSEGEDQGVTAQSFEVPKILNEAEKSLTSTTGILHRFQAFLGSK
ncbi:hypothetical protein HBI39_046180 [Parastagonospora nodorum]|nr:hypothetical protein HBI39_046180 [Parastagonospora nodorum]